MESNQINQQSNKGIVDLNKHLETSRWGRTKNQEETIETILLREFWHNKEYEITKEAPKIFVPDLAILGYKNTQKAIKSLINRGVVKPSTECINTIELVTKQVYCNICRNRAVFIWDKINHLMTFHHFNNEHILKHNVPDLEFSNKPLPEMIDHDYMAISEMKNNQIDVKCKICGDIRTIYIDHYKQCDPFDTSVFIDNPDSETDIKVKIGRNDTFKTFSTKQELKQFIQSKIMEIDQ